MGMIVNYRTGTLAKAAEELRPWDLVYYSVSNGHALAVDDDDDECGIRYIWPNGVVDEIDQELLEELLKTGEFQLALNAPRTATRKEDGSGQKDDSGGGRVLVPELPFAGDGQSR